jgi:hypothetical protein
LRGVKLVISDAHEGLKAAAAKVLKATWQVKSRVCWKLWWDAMVNRSARPA